jgi:uncharacterized protein (TIGR03382 family)
MMNRKQVVMVAEVAAVMLLIAGSASAEPIVRSGTAADAAGLTSLVNQFRVDISNGGIFNPPGAEPPAPGIGRREINWDAPALDAFASPGLMPNDFFNRVSKRGALFSTDGDGVAVSRRNAGGDLSDPSLRFGDLNAQYNSEFAVFSQQRLFAVRGSTVMETTFFIPTVPSARATVNGFGAVFCDVDLDSSTRLEFFDVSGGLIFSQNVSNRDKGLSFLGASFSDGTQIAKVRLTVGNALLGETDGFFDDGFHDVVVMDDFFYGEPVPTPGVLAVGGLMAAAGVSRRRRRA